MIAALVVVALVIVVYLVKVRPDAKARATYIASLEHQVTIGEEALQTMQMAADAYDADVLAFGAQARWEQDVRVAVGVAR